MKKLLAILAIAPMLILSCSKKNPIVFTKKSDVSEVTLSLDTNGTFSYVAKSTQGIGFNENGTYTVEDSLLILRFQFESYEKDCYEIPLPNDTSLIIRHDGRAVLYPTVRRIPEINLDMSKDEWTANLLRTYQGKDFGKLVGTRYFALQSGNLSLIFSGDWELSPSLDSVLAEVR